MMMLSPKIYAENLKTKSDRDIIQEKDYLLNNIACKREKKHPINSSHVRDINYEYLLCVLNELQKRHAEEIKISENLVEIGFNNYIPFEPKYESVEMKNRAIIRTAVKQLRAKENEILFAEFGNQSGKNWFYDLENILFYNIGTFYFKQACKNGVAFCEMQDCSNNSGKYVYRYKLKTVDKCIVSKKIVAEWENISFEEINSSLKAADYWKKFKENWYKVSAPKAEKISGNYGVMLHIELSKGKEINLAAIMKPMLDGIICAFHPADRDLSSFCEKLYCSESLLRGDDKCVLLPREYLYHYRGGIKWNPEDDKCKNVLITVSQSNSHNVLISGNIFKI